MPFRYQPVYVVDKGGVSTTLCECYFDHAGRLTRWTEEPAMAPQGSTAGELQRDLIQMLADAYKWQPVAFDRLHPGMTFEQTGIDVESMIEAMNKARGALIAKAP